MRGRVVSDDTQRRGGSSRRRKEWPRRCNSKRARGRSLVVGQIREVAARPPPPRVAPPAPSADGASSAVGPGPSASALRDPVAPTTYGRTQPPRSCGRRAAPISRTCATR